MDEWIISLVLLSFVVLLVMAYGIWPLFVWRSLGVRGPTPSPFIGNTLDIARKGLLNATREWGQKYGSCYGVYVMRDPILLTSDLDLLKEVFVKDSNSFIDRAPEVPLLPSPVHLGLVTVGGNQWKRLRTILSPSFSTGKLKKMGTFITRCCEHLVKFIQESADHDQPLRLKDLFGAYTLDVFAGTGLGLNTNCLGEHGNDFLNNVEAVLKHSDFINIHSAIAATFPFLTPLMKRFGCSVLPLKETRFVERTIQSIVRRRKARPHVYQAGADLIQLLLNAEKRHPDLTEDEIVAQGIVFFVAGYDTSSTCLQFLAYLLATHPDKQEKLHRKITKNIREFDPINYTTVGKVKYLDSCIFETLRLFPPVAVFGRKAKETRTLNGLTIPAGCSVGVPVASLMRNAHYFPDPDSFIPERFQNEDEPIPNLLKYMPFGLGPRRCVGMPLALYEIKMAVVSILRHFRFVKHPDTPDTITPSRHIVTSPLQPLVVGCQRRQVTTTPTLKSRRRSSDAGILSKTTKAFSQGSHHVAVDLLSPRHLGCNPEGKRRSSDAGFYAARAKEGRLMMQVRE